MQAMVRLFILVVLTAGVVSADSGETGLRALWASRAYLAKPLPESWRPEKVPPSERDVSAFQRFNFKLDSLSIPKFLARYGLPNRYLVTQRQGKNDFLIYDLPSGHAVALYVNKPPRDEFSALVIIDSRGRQVTLLK